MSRGTTAPDSADEPDGGSVERSADGPAEDAVDESVERISERGQEVRDREVERALTRLDAQGDLSPADREAVERLADRLLGRLLAVPERSLRVAADEGDEETVETALELFG